MISAHKMRRAFWDISKPYRDTTFPTDFVRGVIYGVQLCTKALSLEHHASRSKKGSAYWVWDAPRVKTGLLGVRRLLDLGSKGEAMRKIDKMIKEGHKRAA